MPVLLVQLLGFSVQCFPRLSSNFVLKYDVPTSLVGKALAVHAASVAPEDRHRRAAVFLAHVCFYIYPTIQVTRFTLCFSDYAMLLTHGVTCNHIAPREQKQQQQQW
jgi:hypothetical protein